MLTSKGRGWLHYLCLSSDVNVVEEADHPHQPQAELEDKHWGCIEKQNDGDILSVVASTVYFAVICWGSIIRADDTNTLNKVIRKAGSVIGWWSSNCYSLWTTWPPWAPVTEQAVDHLLYQAAIPHAFTLYGIIYLIGERSAWYLFY